MVWKNLITNREGRGEQHYATGYIWANVEYGHREVLIMVEDLREFDTLYAEFIFV